MKNSIPRLEGDVLIHGFPLAVKARGYANGSQDDDLATVSQIKNFDFTDTLSYVSEGDYGIDRG